jgi:hypothetical protein
MPGSMRMAPEPAAPGGEAEEAAEWCEAFGGFIHESAVSTIRSCSERWAAG